MIINHKRKFVFVCVPKTGSTTLSKHFRQADQLAIEKDWYAEKWHHPMSKILAEYDVKDYYSFAYYRNPFDRLVSSWIEFTSEKGHLDTWSGPLLKEFTTWENFAKNFTTTTWANDIHFKPTTYYTHDTNKQIVTRIFKYDNWKEETEQLFKDIKLPMSTLSNKRWRQTNREKNYREYYKDEKTIQTLSDFYQSDLNFFEDSF